MRNSFKIKKVMNVVMAMALMISMVAGFGYQVQAAREISIVLAENNVDMHIVPGETKHFKIPIKAVGWYIHSPSLELKTDKAPFTISNVSLTMYNTTVYSISHTEVTYLEFDVKVSEMAKIGKYPVTIIANYEDNIFGDNELKRAELEIQLQITEEKAPAQLTVSNVELKDALVGCDTDLSFKIKNEGEIVARNIYISMDFEETGIDRRYTTKSMRIGDLAPGQEKLVTLPVSILPTATIGRKSISVNFEYKDAEGTIKTDKYSINVTLKENIQAPTLDVESITYTGELKPGDDFILVATLRNYGGSKANNIAVTIDSSSIGKDGFIKNYFTDSISVPSMNKNTKRDVRIPLIVSKEATGGLKELKVLITFTDDNGISYSKTKTIYPEVIAPVVTTEKPVVVISGVKQSPSNPTAGEKVYVTFDIENRSKVDITDMKVFADNLTGNTFIPIVSEPYQYIQKLAAGKKVRISIPLLISEDIKEGLNNLTIRYTFAENLAGDSVIIPIQNIKNDLGSSSSSRPKLIVSKYFTDVESLKAGSTFNFSFELHNTHSTVAAKNITVTVSKPTGGQDVYSVTQGSNSFFISKINPGESAQNTIELKIKSDTATGAYPIVLSIEYEYDGAEPNPETGEIGLTKSETLSLQVSENARPVVDYVNVYSFDGMILVSNPANLSFEFYNMGKSTLNNVIATVEGDFIKSDGNMYFIGNVASGSSTYAEFEVIPQVEGISKGILKITFEDSNGDEIIMSKEFETSVMGSAPNQEFPGEVDDVFAPSTPQPKKQILPMWLFVLIQIIVFIAFIPITRKIIIGVYKAKLRKRDGELF